MYIKNWNKFNEKIDTSINDDMYGISNLFRKYKGEECNINLENLKAAVSKIGDGELIFKNEQESYMYVEYLKDDSLIFVVHATIGRPVLTTGFQYEISVYRNNPRDVQYGGGYGASGIVETQHTKLFGYNDYQTIHNDIDSLSLVCNDIKKFAIDKY